MARNKDIDITAKSPEEFGKIMEALNSLSEDCVMHINRASTIFGCYGYQFYADNYNPTITHNGVFYLPDNVICIEANGEECIKVHLENSITIFIKISKGRFPKFDFAKKK